MKYIGTHIRELQNGYKADVWGQSDYHIMDWNGCNFRYRPLPGQPLRGFETESQCKMWLTHKWNEKSVEAFAQECGDGLFFSDELCVAITEFHFPS